MRQSQILCVDSDVAGLVLLDAILTPRGYDVIRVNTGQQALEVLERQTVDLILLGVILPGTDGFAICAQIRADERFRDIPVVMMSALKSREDLIRGIEAGADHYLFKPLDHEEMLARIKMLLKQKNIRDSVNNAYHEMNKLTALSREMIETFDASHFDLQTNIDRVVKLLVGKTTNLSNKPRSVLVGVMVENQIWQWFHYEYAFQELNRVKLDFNLLAGIPLPEKNKSKIFLLAGHQMMPEAMLLIKNFQARNMSVENGIGYLSHELCILAVNYGQEINDSNIYFLQQVVVQNYFLHSLSHQHQEVVRAFDYTVYALARAAEAHDDDTGNHIYRVGDYCGILAERLGMKDDFVHAISIQATLHDVGKIYVPSYILKKTEARSAEEWIEFRKHTLWGAKIIGGNPHLLIAQSIALNHHEKWDGSGYPRGLKGDAIPIEARIAAFADQYDTLRTGRNQKASVDHATATKILNHGDARIKPQHFDPRILKAYRETAFLFEEVYERRKG
jgi:response regulator RpfG family c-di-GMP phosphodiesterase